MPKYRQLTCHIYIPNNKTLYHANRLCVKANCTKFLSDSTLTWK